jgi:predicted ATPase
MITRIEATNYRCYEQLGINLSAFCVLAGANGSGKTTLLDIPVLLGDLLRSGNVAAAFFERMLERGARATTPDELTFRGNTDSFVLAVEAEIPTKHRESLVAASSASVKKNESRWPTHVRYEVRLTLAQDHQVEVRNEYLFVFPMSGLYERVRIPMQGENAERADWRFIIERAHPDKVAYRREAQGTRKRAANIDSTLLALARLQFEGESEFGVARWMLDTLTKGIVFFDPKWAELRQASPPGLPRRLMPSGQNLPWLALVLKKEAPKQFAAWVDHVRTALPQIIAIDVREREEDHHAYFQVRYEGKFSVTSSGLSEGTLRILALTLVAYLSEPPRVLIVEEPENSIHPQAIETVMQSLSSLYESRVWVSTHSPVVLAGRKLTELVMTRLERTGAARAILGPNHPRLAVWKGAIDLGTLFATGVFE